MKNACKHALRVALISVPVLCTYQSPLHADELTELYFNSTNSDTGSEVGPNILFVIDTSASMEKNPGFIFDPEIYWEAPYDRNTTYPGQCDIDKVYRVGWGEDDIATDPDGFPYELNADGSFREHAFQNCETTSYYFPLSTLACKKVLDNGFHVGYFAEWRPDPDGDDETLNSVRMGGFWSGFQSDLADETAHEGNTIWRECADDSGIHGPHDTSALTQTYPDNDEDDDGYGADASNARDLVDAGRYYAVATGNFLNWFNAAQSRLAVTKAAFREAAQLIPGSAYASIMRFDVTVGAWGDSNTEGGMVINEFRKVADGTHRQDMITTIWNTPQIANSFGNAGTPLGETLYEALQVFRGGPVTFGADSQIYADLDNDFEIDDPVSMPSVAASRDPDNTANYKSPIQFECQQSAVLFFTDGYPQSDKNAYQKLNDGHMPGYESYAPQDCDGDDFDGDWRTDRSSCMPNIAEYLANEDLSSLTGTQTVTTNTVGFGADVNQDAQDFLRHVAEKGGGTFTQATSFEELRDAFQVVIRDTVAENVSLSSPAVTVNAFNRLAHRDELYFTMFDPILDSVHWPGNVKKYRLDEVHGEFRIVDQKGDPALATNSSTIVFDALSYWTDPDDGPDGNKTPLGGAAGQLSDAHLATRKVYSWLDSTNKELTSPANHFIETNAAITNEMVGLDAPSSELANVIRYMRGYDLHDEDGDGYTNDSRKAMGAAPHGVPAIVTYGDDEDTAEQVIFAPTNDGLLHAIDAESGNELWAFAPTEAMGHFADMYQAPSSTYIGYGLDAPIVTYTEGTEASDRKWLFFGMRRGGEALYALDVTDKAMPKVLWRKSAETGADFEKLAQTWSDPQVARIKRGTADTEGTPVLVFGGGYDNTTQDSAAADAGYVDDTKGNAVFIVDAETGARLWWASSTGADWNHADMRSSIAAPVAIKDKNEDGYHDLVYAADLGGRIWRFDIDNDASTSTTLSVSGGKVASLGAGDDSSSTLTDHRKFFNRPDVVLVAKDGYLHWAVNIGSGDRERPKTNKPDAENGVPGTTNYLFSVRDTVVFDSRSDFTDTITINELYDATDNDIQSTYTAVAEAARIALRNASGWKVELESAGEKALAEARTFDFRVFFTTFDPTPLDTSDCNTDPGRARLYTLDLIHAGAVSDVNNDGTLDKDDRTKELPHGTIPPAITFMFVEDEDGNVEATNMTGRSDEKGDMGNSSNFRKTFWNIERKDETEQ